MDEEKYIGYLKYSGKLVEEGLLDAKKSAQALLGFDGAIRFFVDQQAPHLTQIDYELPVRVRQGTWEILIPKTIAQWIMAGGGVVVTTYLSTAAKKMAEKDFDDVGIRDIFSKALKAMQWVRDTPGHARGPKCITASVEADLNPGVLEAQRIF
jgi:hypothetical protein